jgi:amidase/aspartyl-tRNA(Asn)/glutamyl-tRNA(Gln) amidotransferase subunit A
MFFSGQSEVAEVVYRAVQAFEEAGALVEEVKVGITRPQRELSDVWSRLYMLINLHALENIKHAGRDILKDHREDFPRSTYIGRNRSTNVGTRLLPRPGDPDRDL